MTDTLEVFGTEFTGVTGIKAYDENSQLKTYIRPQGTKSISANGTGIDVTTYAAVDVAVQAPAPTLQTVTKSYTPSTSAQSDTITPSAGYDGIGEVDVTVAAMPSGSVSASASKGAVNNHAISVTPTATVGTAGYLAAGSTNGTAVTVTASELVSGSETKTANGTYDVTNLAQLVVNVSGSSGMNVQATTGYKSRTANSYGDTGLTLTVAKSGTYTVSWTAWRSSSSGTMGTNLHVNSTSGTNQQTWTGTYGQCITLTGQQYNANDVLTIYATSGSNSRTVYVANLVIVQTA